MARYFLPAVLALATGTFLVGMMIHGANGSGRRIRRS